MRNRINIAVFKEEEIVPVIINCSFFRNCRKGNKMVKEVGNLEGKGFFVLRSSSHLKTLAAV